MPAEKPRRTHRPDRSARRKERPGGRSGGREDAGGGAKGKARRSGARNVVSDGGRREKRVNLRALAARLVGEILDANQSLKGVVQREQGRLTREDDRALLRELVAGVIRHLPLIDWAVDECTVRGVEQTQADLLHILRVGVYQILYLDRIPVYAAVDECVEAAKVLNPGAGGFVNGILRSLAEKRDDIFEAPLRFSGLEGAAMRYGMPGWLVRRYTERFGQEADALMSALQIPSPTSLVFLSASAAGQAVPLMEREGFVLIPDGALPLTFSVKGGDPSKSEAFRLGCFYIMDPASQIPALLLPLKGDERVLDLCSAPGGKSVLISGRLNAGGWVLGTDRNARRLRQVKKNIRRTGANRVRLARVDAELALPLRDEWPAVLLDAPCSSLGTLRKNPEIRWQTREEDLAAFSRKQRALLDQTAGTVSPGGVLAYSVCSIEEEETMGVIDGFLADHSEFRPAALRLPSYLKPLLDSPVTGRAFALPHRHAWDGFFVALMRKKGRKTLS